MSGNIDVVLFQSEIVKRFEDVECGDIVARVDEGVREVAADEAGPAGDKDVYSSACERAGIVVTISIPPFSSHLGADLLNYSTVTLLARFRGLSIGRPSSSAR